MTDTTQCIADIRALLDTIDRRRFDLIGDLVEHARVALADQDLAALAKFTKVNGQLAQLHADMRAEHTALANMLLAITPNEERTDAHQD